MVDNSPTGVKDIGAGSDLGVIENSEPLTANSSQRSSPVSKETLRWWQESPSALLAVSKNDP